MEGINGRVVPAIPHDRLRTILKEVQPPEGLTGPGESLGLTSLLVGANLRPSRKGGQPWPTRARPVIPIIPRPRSLRGVRRSASLRAPGHPSPATKTLQTPVHELTTGSTFAGRYQVIEELGHGGMGRVYKVFDAKIQEKVALKLIKPEIASHKDTIERFNNEIRLARRIRHKNVCGMFDIGEAEGAHFITMEYVHGEDLKSMIEMSGSLSLGMLLSVGKQVSDGLAEAHSLGVVHRTSSPRTS